MVPPRLAQVLFLRSERDLAIALVVAGLLATIATLLHWYFYARPEPTAALIFSSLAIGPGIFGLVVAGRLRRALLAAQTHCPGCGYDLRATPQRCPECGATPADHSALIATGEAPLPAAHRYRRLIVMAGMVVLLEPITWAVRQIWGWGYLFASHALLALCVLLFSLVRLLRVRES